MDVVSLVANLQKQLDYYKNMAEEQAAIIRQLTSGPGDIEYIHPLDMSEILNSLVKDQADIFINKEDRDVIRVSGKLYKQSTHIPAKSKIRVY